MRSTTAAVQSEARPLPHRTTDRRSVVPGWIANTPQLACCLAVVFALQVLVRMYTSPNAGLDESEQLIFTQTFQWGYGPQPPLYTWLQILIFKLTGPTILGLALLKNVLLLLTYVLVHHIALMLTRSHVAGVIAAVSLMFIPQMVWESQRDLTHSVLATALAAATLWIAVRIYLNSSPGWYVALGLALGLGHLSKYNYALFAVGIVGAATLVPEFRRIIFSRWSWLSLAVGIAVIIPHAIWAADNPELVLSSAGKFHIVTEATLWSRMGQAFVSLAGAWCSLIITLLAIISLLCWRELIPGFKRHWQRPEVRFLWLIQASALLGVLIMMFAVNATAIKGRWLQPICFCMPLVLATLLHDRLTQRVMHRILIAGAAIALSVMVALPMRVWLGPKYRRADELYAPIAAVARALGPALEQSAVIISDSKFLAGNIRLLAPDKVFVVPGAGGAPVEGSPALMMFDASRRDEPSWAWKKLSTWMGVTNGPISYVEAPETGQGGKPLRVGFVTGTIGR